MPRKSNILFSYLEIEINPVPSQPKFNPVKKYDFDVYPQDWSKLDLVKDKVKVLGEAAEDMGLMAQ
jgi:hypothetical protein